VALLEYLYFSSSRSTCWHWSVHRRVFRHVGVVSLRPRVERHEGVGFPSVVVLFDEWALGCAGVGIPTLWPACHLTQRRAGPHTLRVVRWGSLCLPAVRFPAPPYRTTRQRWVPCAFVSFNTVALGFPMLSRHQHDGVWFPKPPCHSTRGIGSPSPSAGSLRQYLPLHVVCCRFRCIQGWAGSRHLC